YCRLNVRAVIQAQERIKALGAQTVAIMPETQAYAEKFKAEAGAPFSVLTDLDNGYALSLNLAIWLGSEIQRLLSYQDLASFHGNDGWVLAIPANLVVGRDGLGEADRRHLGGGPRRAGEGALRRSGFPQAHGDRRPDRRAEERRQRALIPYSALLPMNCCQSAPRSIRITADATAVRSRPATP